MFPLYASVVEWSITGDCKSPAFGLRWFESNPAHQHMNMWIILWLFFWASGMGLPNYLFKRYKITYYEKSWQHSFFFIFLSIIVGIVYQEQFTTYFKDISFYQIATVIFLLTLWLFVPRLYFNDYYSKNERLRYQVPKFFEIFFQDICFLGGLLTFGVSPITFGLIFFLVHIPVLFFLPKKFALLPITGSLAGGIIFASLQSKGINGFLIALFIHLLFWSTIHFFLSRKQTFGIIPLKR